MPSEVLATTKKQKGGVLLDLQVKAATIMLPPRTPPPPEARRRGKVKKTSPKRSTSRTDVATGLAPCTPLPTSAIEKGGSSAKGSAVKIVASTPLDRRLIDRNRGPDCSGYRGTDNGNTRSRASITPVKSADGNENVILMWEGDSLTAPEERNAVGGGQLSSQSSWQSSYAGSAAKRRAEDLLARVEALEVSFGRVEEQALGRLRSATAAVGDGGVGIDHRQAVSTRQQPRNAGSARGVTAIVSASTCPDGSDESQGECIEIIHSRDRMFSFNKVDVWNLRKYSKSEGGLS